MGFRGRDQQMNWPLPGLDRSNLKIVWLKATGQSVDPLDLSTGLAKFHSARKSPYLGLIGLINEEKAIVGL